MFPEMKQRFSSLAIVIGIAALGFGGLFAIAHACQLTADIKANNSDGPITIPYNTAATITWTSSGATQCTVNPGGWTGTSGSHTTGNLTVSQTYYLTCTGPNGAVGSDLVTVNVQSPPTITADIKANGSDGPITIPYNTAATITWTSQNATACTVTPGNYTGTSGSQSTGNLTVSQTYALNCTGPGGVASDLVTVNVAAQTVTADIKANNSDGPITIPYNTAATITWTSSGATQCTVNPGGWTGTSGSASTGNLTATQIYTLNCTGPGGSASDSVTVNVGAAPQCSLQINKSVDRTTANPGDPINYTISFSNNGITACGNQVIVKDVLDPNLSYVSESHTSNVDPAVYDVGTRTLTWNVHPTDASTQGSITIQASVTSNSSGNCGGANISISNSAAISASVSSQWIYSNTVSTSVNRSCPTVTADIKANSSDGPVTIDYNTAAALTWTSSGATACTVTPGNYTGVSGSASTGNLTATQIYTLNCTGPGGSASDSVTVNVNSANITADIKANGSDGPVTIDYNNSAVLTWTSQNATQCTVSPGGFTGTSGNQSTGNLTATQTYVLTCSNGTQIQTDSVTVNVNPQQNNPPTVTISANPNYINQGQNSVLTWTSQNATQCTAAGGWSGSQSVNGSQTVYPSYTTTYVIVCTNSSGQSAYAQATVTVNSSGGQAPTLTLYSSPTIISQGQSSVLNWNSQNTVSCQATGGNWPGGSLLLNGSQVVYPPYTTTYSMSCVGTNGQTVYAQATVVVNNYNPPYYPPYNNPPTVTLQVNPSSVNQGQSATLTWYSNNANSCNVSGGWSGSRGLSGSETVYPSYTTSYTITCVNNYGIASDVRTVTVGNYNVAGNIQVTKTVRNVTLNQYSFSNTVDAEGLDTLEFEIRVRNNDPYNTLYNVIVRDILPQELYLSAGTTNVDGSNVGEGITSGGITLNAIGPNQERVIHFRTIVFYGAAQNTIVNQAIATTGSGSTQSGFANVNIRSRGQVLGVSEVVTGPEDTVPWVLALGFLATLFLQMFVFKKNSLFAPAATPVAGSAAVRSAAFSVQAPAEVRSVVPARRGYATPQEELEARLAEIKMREARPDTDSLFA